MMKVVGIISEYNPFHNGHEYHISAARDACQADFVVCIMSGSFVQRGEPAIFDKWSRAEMAVLSGADLVLELPFVYSCQPAEIFAYGAVKLLNDIGIIDYVCFGSELGDTSILYKLAEILNNEPDDFKKNLRVYLNEGNTYPKSIGLALRDYFFLKEAYDISDIISKPNNVLGIEYIKAIMRLKSNIKPIAVKRIISDYNETEIINSITSATSIRKEISEYGISKNVIHSVPDACANIIMRSIKEDKNPIFIKHFSDIFLYRLRSMKIEEMQCYINTREGIEHRLKKAAAKAADIEEMIDIVKTKRYTRTYIQRLLCHMLIGLNEKDIQYFKAKACPGYARVLGFNDKGKKLLKKIKENEEHTIITKVANFRPQSELLEKMFSYDLLASDIYSLGYAHRTHKRSGIDFYTSPVRI